MWEDERSAGHFLRRIAGLQQLWERQVEKTPFRAVVLVRGAQARASRSRRHGLLRKLARTSPLCRTGKLLREKFGLISPCPPPGSCPAKDALPATVAMVQERTQLCGSVTFTWLSHPPSPSLT